MQDKAIGIFDSGLGGLTVAKAINSLLPKERIIYYGDTLHLPYGEKSPTSIIGFSEKIVEYLISKNVKLIVIACNSAAANAASHLRRKYHTQIEIRGVIRPMLEAVAKKDLKQVGLIATNATVQSGIYEKLLKEYKPSIELQTLATPLLVPMIEEGFNANKISKEVIKEYLQKFKSIDALLLACTHYPLIKNAVASFFENKIEVLDNADFMAESVKDYLVSENLLSKSSNAPKHEFLVSDYTETFANSASMFFGNDIKVKEHNIFANK